MAMPELTFSALSAPGGLAASLSNLIQTIYQNKAAERREAKTDAIRARQEGEAHYERMYAKREADRKAQRDMEARAAEMQAKAQQEWAKLQSMQEMDALKVVAGGRGAQAAQAKNALGQIAGLPNQQAAAPIQGLPEGFMQVLGAMYANLTGGQAKPVAKLDNSDIMQPNANAGSQSPEERIAAIQAKVAALRGQP